MTAGCPFSPETRRRRNASRLAVKSSHNGEERRASAPMFKGEKLSSALASFSLSLIRAAS